LKMFVHKSKLASLTDHLSRDENRRLWQSGDIWKHPKVFELLKPVKGWVKDERVYVKGYDAGSEIKVHPISLPSELRHNNERVTFFLGFSFDGPIAYNVERASIETPAEYRAPEQTGKRSAFSNEGSSSIATMNRGAAAQSSASGIADIRMKTKSQL
jgi:hypothetical protein